MSKKIEISLILLSVACFILGYRHVLIDETMVFFSDPEHGYALYHYFAESIYNGTLALWNPYMDGGGPFYQIWGMWRLIDPLNIVPVLIGKTFDISIFRLYHIQFFLKILFSSLGVYFLLRYVYANNKKNTVFFVLNLVLFILYANLFICHAHDGYQVSIYWMPYLFLFLVRFFDTKSIRDFLFTIYFLALHLGSASYGFIYGLFFIICFLLITFVLNGIVPPKYLRVLTRVTPTYPTVNNFWNDATVFIKKYPAHIIISLLCLIVMTTPMLVTALESADSFPLARVWNKRDIFAQENINVLALKSSDVSDGAALESQDIPAIFESTKYVFTPLVPVFAIQEYSKYILALLFLIGVIFGKNKWKVQFLIMFILSIFIVAGSYTPVYGFLSTIFFPLEYVRNTIFGFVFLIMFYFYFIGLGILFLANLTKSFRIFFGVFLGLSMAMLFIFIVSGKPYFLLQDKNKMDPDFNHKAQEFSFNETRKFALPRTGWYLFDPILYEKNAAISTLAFPAKGKIPEQMPYYREWNKVWKTSGRSDRHGAVYGLRSIFWTKNYHKIYLWGENDINIFNALMGVGEKVIDFKKYAITMNDSDVRGLLDNISGHEFKKLLQKAVIIDGENFDNRNEEKAKAIGLIDAASISNNQFSYKVTSYEPGDIKLKVTSDAAGMLLFRDGYDKNWKAYLDGREVPIKRANIGFKAIELTKGVHEVEFKYLPVLFIISFYLFVILSFAAPVLIFALTKPTGHYRKLTLTNKQILMQKIRFRAGIVILAWVLYGITASFPSL